MVLVTGILHAMKLAQPTVTIDVLASVRNAAVLDGNPDVGTIYRINKARPWSFLVALARARRVHYDAVLDSMVTGPSLTSMFIMWASGAAHRIGVGGRANNFALTLPVSAVPGAVHYVDHSAALLSPFGVDPARYAPTRSPQSDSGAACGRETMASAGGCGWGVWRPRLFLTPAEITEAEAFWRSAADGSAGLGERGRQRRLAVNVSAGTPRRCWCEERFIATVLAVRERFPDVCALILGTPADEERKRRIGSGCDAPIDRTANFRQMMALVATCDCVLTPDTSVTHIASAFGKPVVAMFAGTGGPHWGPYGTSGQVVSTPALTLEALPVEPVVRALEQLLGAEGESAGGRNSVVGV